MKLFLDDVRPVPDDSWQHMGADVKEFIGQLDTWWDHIEAISLDHDLGTSDASGYDVVKWIEEQVIRHGRKARFFIHVHSMNSVGRQNMLRAIERIEKYSQGL